MAVGYDVDYLHPYTNQEFLHDFGIREYQLNRIKPVIPPTFTSLLNKFNKLGKQIYQQYESKYTNFDTGHLNLPDNLKEDYRKQNAEYQTIAHQLKSEGAKISSDARKKVGEIYDKIQTIVEKAKNSKNHKKYLNEIHDLQKEEALFQNLSVMIEKELVGVWGGKD